MLQIGLIGPFWPFLAVFGKMPKYGFLSIVIDNKLINMNNYALKELINSNQNQNHL